MDGSIGRTAAKQAKAPNWVAVIAFGFCALVALLDGADSQSLAIAAPLIAKDLHISAGGLGLVFSTGVLGGALGAMISGTLADRFGAKRMLVVCTIWFGCWQLATAYVDAYWPFVIIRFLAGLGLGGAAPCFLGLAAGHIPEARRARLLALLWAFFPVGGFFGGLANGWIISNLTWRSVFTIGGVIPLVVALALALIVREAPKPAPVVPAGTDAAPRVGVGSLLSPALRTKTLLTWCVFFGAFGALAAAVVWTPSLLVRVGEPAAHGAQVLSWHAIGALISMAAAGVLLERFGPRLLAIGLVGGALAIAVMGFNLHDYGAVITCMVLVGVFLGVAGSGAIALAGTLFPGQLRGTGLGWSMGVARLGQMLIPMAMGVGFEHATPWAVLLGCAALPALAALAAVALARLHPRAQPLAAVS